MQLLCISAARYSLGEFAVVSLRVQGCLSVQHEVGQHFIKFKFKGTLSSLRNFPEHRGLCLGGLQRFGSFLLDIRSSSKQ